MMMMLLLLDVIVVLVKKMFKMRYVYMFFDVRFSVVVSRVPFVSKISLDFTFQSILCVCDRFISRVYELET